LREECVKVIRPESGWRIADFRELREYRDLFFFLVWRDVKVLYAQTILGFAWAILNPLTQIVIFTIVFGRLARISTDGIPYVLFSSVAVIPWTYMSESMIISSQSLITGQAMLDKIYFPRLIFPLTGVLSKMVDFGISLIILLCIGVYYRITPTWNLLLLPLFIVFMMCIPAAVGIWLSSLAVRFRDVKFAIQFAVRMLIYTAPIVYSAQSIPGAYRIIYSLNPLVGVIEGFRACLLGLSVPWPYIWPGMITTAFLLVTGALYFKRMERIFVDVI